MSDLLAVSVVSGLSINLFSSTLVLIGLLIHKPLSSWCVSARSKQIFSISLHLILGNDPSVMKPGLLLNQKFKTIAFWFVALENLNINPLSEDPFDTSNLNNLNLLRLKSVFVFEIFSIALSLKGITSRLLLVCFIWSVASLLASFSFIIPHL